MISRNEIEIELHCHGGLIICQAIIDDLTRRGCHFEPEMVGAKNSVECQSIESLAGLYLSQAQTLPVACVLLDQQQGALREAFEALKQLLLQNQFDRALEKVRELIGRSYFGLKLIDPWRVTLAGPANVGKSSLTNAILGKQRVIVHSTPGTTRDAVDTLIAVSAWPMALTDTAGIRSTDEPVEREGIATSMQRWEDADIGVLVVDATVGWTAAHSALIESRPGPYLVAINKCDLTQGEDISKNLLATPIAIVRCWAESGAGIEPLLSALGNFVDLQKPPAGVAVPFHPQQVEILKDVLQIIESSMNSKTNDPSTLSAACQALDALMHKDTPAA